MKKCVLLAVYTVAVALVSEAANWYYGTGFELPFTVSETNFLSQYDTAGLELATNTTPRQYWTLPTFEDGLLIKFGDKKLYDIAIPFSYDLDNYSLVSSIPPQNSILRYLTPDHRRLKIPDGESLYYEAAVRFTASDEMLDPEQVLKGDKIAVWLYEQEKGDGTTEYQLMITGGYIIKGHDGIPTVSKPHNYRANYYNRFNTNTCYRVIIKCIDTLVKEETIPGFVVSIGDTLLETGRLDDKGLSGYTLADQVHVLYNCFVPSAVLGTNSTVEAVRFAGDGLIDNVLISNNTDKESMIGTGNNIVVFRLKSGVESLTYTYEGLSHTISNDYYISGRDGMLSNEGFCINGIRGADGYTDTPIINGVYNFTTDFRDGKIWYSPKGFNMPIYIQAVRGVMNVIDGQGNTTCITNSDELVDMFAEHEHGGTTNFQVKVLQDMADMGLYMGNSVDVILDLNGHTISNRVNSDTVDVDYGCSLVITNTANGVGRVTSESGWGIYCDCPDAMLTLAGGVYDTEFHFTTEGEYTGFKITSEECKFKRERLDESMLTALRQALANGMGSGYEFQDGTGADEGWLVIRRKAAALQESRVSH